MEDLLTLSGYSLIIFIVSMVGAGLPLLMKLDDKRLHLMISFSSGIFLGVLFLMLLPEALHKVMHDEMFSLQDGMYAILAGFLVILVLDFILKHNSESKCDCKECMDKHSHDITSLSAFIGLGVHSFFDGLALAAAFTVGEEVGIAVLIAMCIHKVVVVFSLSSTFLLSSRKKDALKYLTAFCLITPLSAIVSFLVLGGIEPAYTGIALAFAVGIFTFVTMCDIIPEAFHRKKHDLASLAWMFVGLGLIIAISLLMASMGHVH